MLQSEQSIPAGTSAVQMNDVDYRVLADFRHALRGFMQFSEQAAEKVGLTPQQHQALLAVRAEAAEGMSIGLLADRLMVRPHSASGLADRLVRLELLTRNAAGGDRRKVSLTLTSKADALLQVLSASHYAELRRLRPLLSELLGRV